MRLQLDSLLTGPTRAGGSGQTAPAGGSGSDSRIGSSAAQDSVSVSGVSGVLNRAATDRAQRVQELGALVQSGNYQAPSSDVSSAIVAHALS
jgi:hypothetical protein